VCITDHASPGAASLVTAQQKEDRLLQLDRVRGVGSTMEGIHALMAEQCDGVKVAVDDMIMAGQAGEFIKTFPVSQIESVIYLRPAEATARFGMMGGNGVILIYTRGNGPTVQRDPTGAGT
jgi:hypothetical protein